MEIIQVEQITKTFAGRFQLGPLNFNMVAGETLGVVGPSMSGKTTLLKLIWGFLKPDHGRIALFGIQPHLHQLRLRRFVGYLPQNLQCDLRSTARQFLRFAGHFYEGWDENHACALLRKVDIDPDRTLDILSKADRVRVGIVAAAVHRPALLLLDEPLSEVDAATRREIVDFLRRVASENCASMLVSCVCPSHVDSIADNILMLPPLKNRAKARLKGREYRDEGDLFKR